ncbi:Na/Pi symporter [Algoriphagus sediminis]|uniref:Na/Pi symporter n=1 Tax=Algoriphagus sediminis TaxID=3057113 RepID=A0ABT7YBX4_9BACT|nr:Na/Pi symporter [Algoriphagus sediminis]MDN3204025.1 Na/Pi symporter [Algoriphagus sediminis]
MVAENLEEPNNSNKIKSYILMVIALLLFIFAIDLLTVSMGNLNNSVANGILLATENPFVGLFIGILMTALIQSSSTVTSTVVAVVAAGNLELSQAVPIVLGANIGTTLTSTLVSLSYIMKKKRFARALSAGILHDFFNMFTVFILLPLELIFGFLSNLATQTAHLFADESYDGTFLYSKTFTRPLTEWLTELIGIPFLTLIISIFLIFGAIKLLTSSVFKAFIFDSFNEISNIVFKFPYRALFYGTLFTAAVQSSTVTTSLIIPLVANKRVTLARSFPFIIGANIGTTITAAIAAVYKTEAAIALALVHFFINLFGALIMMPIPAVRNLPVRLAKNFGKKSAKNRLIGFAYILLVFFIIPFLLIYFSD